MNTKNATPAPVDMEAYAKAQAELRAKKAAIAAQEAEINAMAKQVREGQNAIIAELPEKLGVDSMKEVQELIRDYRKDNGEVLRTVITPDLRKKIADDLHGRNPEKRKFQQSEIESKYSISSQTAFNIRKEENLVPARKTS